VIDPSATPAKPPFVWWAVAHQAIVDRDEALLLDRQEYRVALRAGWKCLAGAASVHGPAAEARITQCEKHGELVEFSVQCDPSRPKDRTQVRFRPQESGSPDFIEVACEIRNEPFGN
jgi:hypothetical protein